jgi:hypothetical protein
MTAIAHRTSGPALAKTEALHVSWPTTPYIAMHDPEQTARNLRAVAERMRRAADDLDALCTGPTYTGDPDPYVIADQRTEHHGGLYTLTLRRTAPAR